MYKKLGTAECLNQQPKKGPGTKASKLVRHNKAKTVKSLGKDLDGAFRANNRMDGKA